MDDFKPGEITILQQEAHDSVKAFKGLLNDDQHINEVTDE